MASMGDSLAGLLSGIRDCFLGETARGSGYYQFMLTETVVDIPFFSMVTPIRLSAISMEFLL